MALMTKRCSVPSRAQLVARTLAYLGMGFFMSASSCNEEEIPPNPPTPVVSRPFYMALTTFAPRPGDAARDQTWNFVRDNTDLIGLHYDSVRLPWEALAAGDVPQDFQEEFVPDTEDSRGHLLYVAVTPLDEARTGVVGDASGGPFPASLGPALFSNPRLRRAFVTYSLYIQETFRPAYMAVGIEVNLYDSANPADFEHFVTLYKETHEALKSADPGIVVFPTFQHEFVIGNDQFSLFELFEPRLDRIGLATYPSSAGFTPETLLPDYFSRLRSFSTRPMVVTETGFGSRPFANDDFQAEGSDALQRDYLLWLLDRAEADSMDFMVWFFPTDIPDVVDQLPESSSFRFFGYMGITSAGFRDKTITELWREHLARPHVSNR